MTAGGGRFAGARIDRMRRRGWGAVGDAPRADPSAELPGAYRRTQFGKVIAVATAPGSAAAV